MHFILSKRYRHCTYEGIVTGIIKTFQFTCEILKWVGVLLEGMVVITEKERKKDR